MGARRTILLTGASGFIGNKLVARLVSDGHRVRLATRAESVVSANYGNLERINVGEIGPTTDWRIALNGCDTVVHLAGQVPSRAKNAEIFRSVNDEGTRRLVDHSAELDVNLFFHMSSINAVVDNDSHSIISDFTPSNAKSAYGLSKHAAEVHVAGFVNSDRVGVSLRPPIVYDESARGNWRLLQNLAALPIPLPFGSVNNRRSIISLENLVDASSRVISLGCEAISGAFGVAEDPAVCLADILKWLRSGMGKQQWLLPVPESVIWYSLSALGRHQLAARLLGNLEINSQKFRKTYNWTQKIESKVRIKQIGENYRVCLDAKKMF